ncbi:MAG: GGDEF domain-containing protein [Rhodanobacter sp.]|nr:MAG: GGDEF domain-containing protein [Rhodanobacter sp.]
MNYSLIPDFLAMGGLVLVFASLLRRTHQTRLRYWVVGWLMILVHIIAQLVSSGLGEGRIADAASAISLSMLLLTSVTFIWAGNNMQHAWRRDLLLTLLATVPDLAFFACAAYDLESTAIYLPLTLLGMLSTLWLFRGGRCEAERAPPWWRLFSIFVAYAVQALLVLHASVEMALIWMLFSHYLAAAYFFYRGAPSATVGVIFTTLSFAAWAGVFPVADALATVWPQVHFDNEVWNLPKFLVATGMIFTLLEEQMGQAEHAALHDPLTGLPNRRMFVRRFDAALLRAREQSCRIAVFVLDLNGFKQVNDLFGHAAGDALLQAVAKRLQKSIRSNDTLARMGGDEFAVILPDLASTGMIDQLSKKLVGAFSEAIALDGHHVDIEASIGMASYPDDGENALHLYAIADHAMYVNKPVSDKV